MTEIATEGRKKFEIFLMDSNTHQIYDQNCQPNSGLLRFRSAPSALLANFTENGVLDKTVGFETDGLISGFMSSDGDLESPNVRDFEEKSPTAVAEAAGFYLPATQHQHQSFTGLPPHYPRPNGAVSSSAVDGSLQFMGMRNQANSMNSNLARQRSSPAGMFTNLSVQNGFGSMKNMSSINPDEELSPSSSGSKSRCTLSSRPPSSLGMISQVSDVVNAGNSDFIYQYGHWHDPSSFMESLSGVKRELDNEGKLFSDTQNGEAGNRVQMLSHCLSLPKTSSEMAAVEKIFQINDSVPCKIRAKRGFATHPRSIAERVRRTKISERMRKLQELVPNIDKQMNTAEMLDMAVEYIKDLQRQFKMLSDNQANCKCMNTEKKPIQNQMV